MTVRLLVDFKDPADGKQYVVGNLYTSAANEGGMIASKMATSDLTGGTAWAAPAQQESIDEARSGSANRLVLWNASGTAIVHPVTGRNMPVTETLPVGYDTVNPPSDIDWHSLRSTNEWSNLIIDSPYSPGHILHPSLCHIKQSFAGYRFWMVFTPYPNNDSSFENPCVAASNDLVEWDYPATNPIVAAPGGSNYNSDTDIYFDEAGSRLVVLFREVTGTTSRLKITTSGNGTDWTAPVTIYTASNVNTATATDIATPSIWFNDTTSKWEIVGLNAKDNGSAWPVVKITSNTLLSGWDTSATWTVLTITPPSGRKWWNFQFRRLTSGSVVGLAQDNSGVTGGSGNLYSLYSADGSTFGYKLLDTQATKAWYRATFVLLHDVVDGKFSLYVLGSKLAEARLYVQVMPFDAESFALTRAGSTAAIMSGASIGNIQGTLHADTFNRADDATGLGTSTSGHTYTQSGTAPTVIGISSNSAYPVNTAGNCQAYRDVGSPNCLMKATVSVKTSGEFWLLGRYVDNSNKIRIGGTHSSQLTYQVITAGSFAVNEQLGITPVAGDEVSASFMGNQIKIYLNGKLIARRTCNQGLTTQNFGIGMSGTTVKLDNLAAVSIT